MLDLKTRANKLFDSIGSDRVNQTEVSFYCLLYTSPFPLAWVLVLYALQQSEASNSLNHNYVNLYYQLAPLFSLSYLALALFGWSLLSKNKASSLFEHASVQLIAINTFIMSAFFGFFTTPVSLAIIAAVGIGSFIYDRNKIWAGMATITLLCFFTTYLHLQGLPAIPIAASLSVIEGPLLAWTSVLFLFTSILFIGVFALFASYLMESSNEKKALLESLSGKLARYLSPQVYSSIFRGEREVRIETYRKKLTVFFSDIKSFTEITDGMESEALSKLLNAYLNEMSIIALKHGGTIDKFIGDAIMIFFGDPESKGDKADALACVSMAIEMRERMKELQSAWYRQGISDPLEIRIGINSGYCTVGNFGSDDRLDYTVVGTQVNLAMHLESQAKPNSILISPATYELIKNDIACEAIESTDLKTENKLAFQVLGSLYNTIQEQDKLEQETQNFLKAIDFTSMNESEKAFIINSVQKLL